MASGSDHQPRIAPRDPSGGAVRSARSARREPDPPLAWPLPVPQPRSAGIDPHLPKKDDPEHVAAWRKRMGTDAAKETYKLRASTSECANADLRSHRGLQQLPVRGIEKTVMLGLWMAITYNALLWIGSGAAGL